MAVYLFLKDKGMLEIDTLVQFANQMNQKGWFEDAKIKCTEDAIQDYKDMSFSKIDDYEYKERESSKMSKKGVASIKSIYNQLNTAYSSIPRQ